MSWNHLPYLMIGGKKIHNPRGIMKKLMTTFTDASWGFAYAIKCQRQECIQPPYLIHFGNLPEE